MAMRKTFVPWLCCLTIVFTNYPRYSLCPTWPSAVLPEEKRVPGGLTLYLLVPWGLEYYVSNNINCLCLGKWVAISDVLPSFPTKANPRNVLEAEAAPHNVCSCSLISTVTLMEEETLTAQKAVDKWPTSCSADELSFGSPKVAAFPCGWGIWLSAASKSPIWNALCISLEGSQTVLWKLQLVASHK